MIDAYHRHNERVRESVAPNRLLEFNVQQGWKPLCEFLEFDVPPSDFPHLNAGTSGPSKIIAKAVRQLSLRRILHCCWNCIRLFNNFDLHYYVSVTLDV